MSSYLVANMLHPYLLFLVMCALATALLLGETSDESARKFAPKFRRALMNTTLKPAGSTVRFKCLADGNPQPNITWIRNNNAIERDMFPPRYGKWSVSLEEVTRSDNGHYTCLVCNELGCIRHTFDLTVMERYPSKPYIQEGYPGNRTVVLNDTIQLTCPTNSYLEPYVYWVKAYDNFTITDGECQPGNWANGEYRPGLPGYEIKSDNPADEPETLTIANVTLVDHGWYACVAMNSLGTVTALGYLTVLERECKCECGV